VAIAARMTACCEGPLGAVRELLRPSWFTAAPVRITSACGAGAEAAAELPGARRRSVRQASPRAYPSLGPHTMRQKSKSQGTPRNARDGGEAKRRAAAAAAAVVYM